MLKRMKLYWGQLFGAQRGTSCECTSLDSALENSTTFVNHLPIPHSNTLIPHLKNDHQVIFNLYSEISSAIETQQFEKIHAILGQFHTCFHQHLRQENTQFYAYLKQYFSEQPAQLAQIQHLQQTLQHESVDIFHFLQKWQDQPIDEINLLEFSQEYKNIGQILMRRITQQENELYSLYPPHIV